jgi:acetyltransferase-like isoleucine patch superfamily enzyme
MKHPTGEKLTDSQERTSSAQALVLPSSRSVGNLAGTVWCFRHDSGFVAADELRLLNGGRIIGYEHPNETSWRLRDGRLEFLAFDGRVSTRFDQLAETADGLLLSGPFLLRPDLNITLILQQRPWKDGLPDFELQTKYGLKAGIEHLGWKVGDHTYGLPTVYASGPERLIIGKYSSIGGAVTIVLAGHRPDYVTTYPFVVYSKHWRSVPATATDHRGKGDITIGNDVWIGHGAFIAPGVQVADGAVIAAMSVVTRDVEPYAIVAGNPAKLVRHRFDPETISTLLAVRWWDWPDSKVDANLDLLLSPDIARFIGHASMD